MLSRSHTQRKTLSLNLHDRESFPAFVSCNGDGVISAPPGMDVSVGLALTCPLVTRFICFIEEDIAGISHKEGGKKFSVCVCVFFHESERDKSENEKSCL